MSQEPPGSPVPDPEPGAQGDPRKGAEGNPGGPREEASPAAGRAHPSALAAPLSGHRVGRGPERPSAPLKVSGEPFFPESCLSAARVSREGASRAGTSAGPRAGLPPRLSLLPTRPLSAGLASAAASPPLPPARARARARAAASPQAAALPRAPGALGPARPRPRARTME